MVLLVGEELQEHQVAPAHQADRGQKAGLELQADKGQQVAREHPWQEP